MARLRYNGLTTTLGSGLTAADTTITFAGPLTHAGGQVPTIVTGDVIPLALVNAAGVLVEIVNLTAYTQGASTGTIQRAREGTAAATHAAGAKVVHGPLAADLSDLSTVTWIKTVDSDSMAANTRWTVEAGTWTFGGAHGVQQTSTATDAFLRLSAGVSPAASHRIIKATVRSVSGQIVGVGFGQNGAWFNGSLGIGLDSGARLWYDRFGSGGSTITFAHTRDTDYELMVAERVRSAEFHVYINGVKMWEIARPADVVLGGVGLYCRSGQGWFRNVSVWEGTVPFALPSGAV